MHIGKSAEDLFHDEANFVFRRKFFLFDKVAKVASFTELGHHVVPAFMKENIIKFDDVHVIEFS